MIWKHKPDPEFVNSMGKNSLAEHLGIEITEVGDNYIKAKMPVDQRTRQPQGLLHGGASVALSETVGSLASVFTSDDPLKESVVGIEINANHLRPATKGWVHSVTKPVRIGRKIQVWNTDIYDDQGKLVCTSRLTTVRLKNE